MDVTFCDISLKNWYYPQSEIVNQLSKIQYIPRPSGSLISWWKKHDIINEFFQSIDHIVFFFEKIIIERNPKLLIMADDTGPIEQLIVVICKKYSIPTLLLEHGYGFNYESSLTKFKSKTNDLKKYIYSFLRMNKQLCFTRFTTSKPTYTGYISPYMMELNRSLDLIKQEGEVTGFSYYDLLFQNNTILNQSSSKKVLVISTGKSIFNRSDNAVLDFCLNIHQNSRYNSQDYQYYYRPKPGEFISEEIKDNLHHRNILIDSIPSSIDSIKNSYAVIGEPSNLLIESNFLGKNTGMLGEKNNFDENLLLKSLNIERINENNFFDFLKEKSDHTGIIHQHDLVNKSYYYLGIDGSASKKISRLVKYISNLKSKKNNLDVNS